MEMVESEFNAAKIVHLLPKLEWSALKSTASDVRSVWTPSCVSFDCNSDLFSCFMQLGVAELPDAIPESPESDEEFLRSVHTLIMDVGVSINVRHTVISVVHS